MTNYSNPIGGGSWGGGYFFARGKASKSKAKAAKNGRRALGGRRKDYDHRWVGIHGFEETSTRSEAKFLGIHDLGETSTRSEPKILENPGTC